MSASVKGMNSLTVTWSWACKFKLIFIDFWSYPPNSSCLNLSTFVSWLCIVYTTCCLLVLLSSDISWYCPEVNSLCLISILHSHTCNTVQIITSHVEAKDECCQSDIGVSQSRLNVCCHVGMSRHRVLLLNYMHMNTWLCVWWCMSKSKSKQEYKSMHLKYVHSESCVHTFTTIPTTNIPTLHPPKVF